MLKQRMVAVFALVAFAFMVVTGSLAALAGGVYAADSKTLGTVKLELDTGRGPIYDCHWNLLTDTDAYPVALIEPGSDSYRTFFDVILERDRAEFYTKIQQSEPFLMPVTQTKEMAAQMLFSKTRRYLASPTAPHLLGYLDGESNGVSGIEKAFDGVLQKSGTSKTVYCAADARGVLIEGTAPMLTQTRGTGAGVMLTLDLPLQRACEVIAQSEMEKGSIVVMESATGRVRASVSMPSFDPNNVGKSIEAGDTSLTNRSISAFSVGSVFKPLLTAVAMEAGANLTEMYECTGSIEIGDHIYRCAYGKGHGEVDMEKALALSCNCYFAQLGITLGGEGIVEYAQRMGFGQSSVIASPLRTAAGNLPSAAELVNLGALVSISFGQGTLLATPVQIAAFMNVFANKGVYIEPSFVEGVANSYSKTITDSHYLPVMRRAVLPKTAEDVRTMLVNVVADGLGKSAKPDIFGAGGKTGTAQTGRNDADGNEIMDAWFAGFYPAENPQYTIVVLLDSGDKGSEDACHIFAKVANVLRYFLAEVDK